MEDNFLELKYNKTIIDELKNDFSVLQSSVKQYQRVMQQVTMFEKKLDLDPDVIKNILFKVLIKFQIRHKRYHYQVESQSKQERLVVKKEQSEELKGELQKLLLESISSELLNKLVDDTFNSYIYDHLSK